MNQWTAEDERVFLETQAQRKELQRSQRSAVEAVVLRMHWSCVNAPLAERLIECAHDLRAALAPYDGMTT